MCKMAYFSSQTCPAVPRQDLQLAQAAVCTLVHIRRGRTFHCWHRFLDSRFQSIVVAPSSSAISIATFDHNRYDLEEKGYIH